MVEQEFRPMEQQWGCTDPFLISRFAIEQVMERIEREPSVVTTAGYTLPPLFVSGADYAALVERCLYPPIWEPEPPVPISRLMAVTCNIQMGCWELPRAVDANGYGRYPMITWKQRGIKSEGGHRVFYRQLVGPIPEDKPFIDHRCNNTNCVYPRHVQAVTQAVNNRLGHEDKRNSLQPKLWQLEPTVN